MDNKAKAVIGIGFGVIVAGGLISNEYILTKRVDSLSNKIPVLVVKEAVVSPTVTPIASPTAVMRKELYTPIRKVTPIR